MIFSRAARTAGKKPPINPINSEKPTEVARIDGESTTKRASSELL
jgi:hypothetical protein